MIDFEQMTAHEKACYVIGEAIISDWRGGFTFGMQQQKFCLQFWSKTNHFTIDRFFRGSTGIESFNSPEEVYDRLNFLFNIESFAPQAVRLSLVK